MIGQWKVKVGVKVSEGRGKRERGQRRKKWNSIWSRSTWPRKTASSKGSHSCGISEDSDRQAQSGHIPYKYNNWVVHFLNGLIGAGSHCDRGGARKGERGKQRKKRRRRRGVEENIYSKKKHRKESQLVCMIIF